MGKNPPCNGGDVVSVPVSLAGLSLKACCPPPSHSAAVLLLCQAWLSLMVQPQSLEDSENGGQLGARLFLSRFHHCLNKIKKMRVLPRAKGLSPSEAPSIFTSHPFFSLSVILFHIVVLRQSLFFQFAKVI